MTVKLLFLAFVFLAGHSFANAQTAKPFAELDRQVEAQRGGFSGSKQPLATAFNAERKRLGKQFEAELMKYLGDDVEKHYWISSFLEADSYLQGNSPLLHLSLLIKQQGLSLLENRTDEDSLFMVVSLSESRGLERTAELSRFSKNAQSQSRRLDGERRPFSCKLSGYDRIGNKTL